jgi:hypothetical protein
MKPWRQAAQAKSGPSHATVSAVSGSPRQLHRHHPIIHVLKLALKLTKVKESGQHVEEGEMRSKRLMVFMMDVTLFLPTFAKIHHFHQIRWSLQTPTIAGMRLLI